jgi:hypothetical protein
LNSVDSIGDALYETLKAFERCSIWTVRAILETDVDIGRAFKVVNSASKDYYLSCILSSANAKFEAHLMLGIQGADLVGMFPNEVNPEIQKDGLGEIANVITGLFLADDHFTSKFGYLKPSVPFFNEGAFAAKKEWGIEGTVEAHGKPIYLRFSIREI